MSLLPILLAAIKQSRPSCSIGIYREAKLVFITPDNCLEQLRYRTLLDGKPILLTTYSIKRGFWLLDPTLIPKDKLLYAATLGWYGARRHAADSFTNPRALQVGRLHDHRNRGHQRRGHTIWQGSRVFRRGVGHVVPNWRHHTPRTPAAAVVHDCQVLRETLYPEVFDTMADVIFIAHPGLSKWPNHINRRAASCGICWIRACSTRFLLCRSSRRSKQDSLEFL